MCLVSAAAGTAHGESSSRASGSACAFKRSERSGSRRSESWTAAVGGDDLVRGDTDPGCSRWQKLESNGADIAYGYGAGTTEDHRALVMVRLRRRSRHVIRTAIIHRHVGGYQVHAGFGVILPHHDAGSRCADRQQRQRSCNCEYQDRTDVPHRVPSTCSVPNHCKTTIIGIATPSLIQLNRTALPLLMWTKSSRCEGTCSI